MDQEKENHLYQLAIEQLRLSGIKFTVEDLCKVAKVSKKTFYVLYPTKGDFAKASYRYAFHQYEFVAEAYKKNPNKGTLYNLLTWVMDISMIVSEKTFNLYSMNVLLQEEANKKKEEIKQDFLSLLKETFQEEITSHPAFFYSLEKTLASLSHEKEREPLLKDLTEILMPWMR